MIIIYDVMSLLFTMAFGTKLAQMRFTCLLNPAIYEVLKTKGIYFHDRQIIPLS